MDYDVMEARYVRDYVVWLRFRDGTTGEVDLGPELWGRSLSHSRTWSTSGNSPYTRSV